MSLTWMLIRGSGLIAYAMLAASTIWGLLLSAKVLGRSVSVKTMTLVHESLAVGAIVATLIHVVALVSDEFVEFDVIDVLIPGASAWEPFAVSLGVVAMYGLVLVTGSFYIRQRIGQSRWRALHYVSFGVFASSAAHGIMAGTDAQHPAALGMYVATTAAVILLIALRGLLAGAADAKPARPSRTEKVAEPAA